MALYGYVKKYKKTLALRGVDSQDVHNAGIAASRKKIRRPNKVNGRKSATVPKRALWQEAFPDQIDNRIKEGKSEETRFYNREAASFKKHANEEKWVCPVRRAGLVGGSGRIDDVHHTHGKLGKLLRYKPWWLGVSRIGHQWIEANKTEARLRGWLCEIGKFNVQPKIRLEQPYDTQ